MYLINCMEKIVVGFGKTLYFLAGVILMVMMTLISFDVMGRYFLGSSIHGTFELSMYFMTTIVFFTLPYTQYKKGHIFIDLVFGRVSLKIGLAFSAVAFLIGTIFMLLITWQGILSVADAWRYEEISEGLVAFPLYPVKAAIPLGSFAFAAQFFLDLIKVIQQMRGRTNV